MPTKNHYETLGISPGATDDEIKQAYRRLARLYHPDSNSPDASQELFQVVTLAYNVLSDPTRRNVYDSAHRFPDPKFETPKNNGANSETTASSSQAQPRSAGGKESSIDSRGFLKRVFGSKSVTLSQNSEIKANLKSAIRPENIYSKLQGHRNFQFTISIFEALHGTTRGVVLLDVNGREDRYTVNIPANVSVTEPVLLDCGGEGLNRLERIEATVIIEPHPLIDLRGVDIVVRLPLTIPEALKGIEVQVPTYDGSTTVKIPAGFDYLSKIRIKGAGAKDIRNAKNGDLYIAPFIVPPTKDSEPLQQAVKVFDSHYDFEVRANLPRTLRVPIKAT